MKEFFLNIWSSILLKKDKIKLYISNNFSPFYLIILVLILLDLILIGYIGVRKSQESHLKEQFIIQKAPDQTKKSLRAKNNSINKASNSANPIDSQSKEKRIAISELSVEYDIQPSNTPTPSPTSTPTPTFTPTPTPKIPGLEYISKSVKTEKGKFNAKIISADINLLKLIVDSASDTDCSKDCPVKPLYNYVKDNSAVAGINGTYFCPPDYSECASKKNSFDFPIFNSRINKWISEYRLYWNDRAIIYKDQSGMHFYGEAKKAPYYANNKNKVEAAIVNAPGLLENNNVIASRFPLTEKQKSKDTKAGIGFNNNMVYLVVGYSVNMEEFGYLFKAIGATDALNLDSGGSAALWINGYKIGPGRNLPNAILFAKK